jgi:hypothetical protein
LHGLEERKHEKYFAWLDSDSCQNMSMPPKESEMDVEDEIFQTKLGKQSVYEEKDELLQTLTLTQTQTQTHSQSQTQTQTLTQTQVSSTPFTVHQLPAGVASSEVDVDVEGFDTFALDRNMELWSNLKSAIKTAVQEECQQVYKAPLASI